MARRWLPLFAILASPAAGCGSNRLDARDAARDRGADTSPDASADAARDAVSDGASDAAGLTGRRAFDVTVTLTAASPSFPSGPNSFPTSAKATVVVDTTAGWLLMGGVGQGSTTTIAATGDKLAIAAPVTLVVPFANACNGGITLNFASLELAVDSSGRLQGTGTGQASYITGDVGYNQTFTATLDGAPDATPPSLVLGTGVLDPLAPARLAASEPLPPGTKARLVAADGSIVELSPEVPAVAAPAFVVAFRVPFALSFGGSYQVALDQMADFAGNHAVATQAPPLVTPAAPALLTDGGFESTTGMDSALISAGGDLPVISGTKSYYLPAGTWQAGSVTFRLPVHAGDQAVHFSYRVVSMYQSAGFYGAIVVASAGAPIASLSQLPMGTPTTTVTSASGGTLTVGLVSTLDLTLPDASAPEVFLRISGASSGCGLPPPSAGLIIDDVGAGG